MTAELLGTPLRPEVSDAPSRRPWVPLADRSLSAWFGVGLIVSTVFAGDSALLGLPFAPQRVFLALMLVALLNERIGRAHAFQLRGVHLFMAASLLWCAGSAIAAGTFQGDGIFALLDRLAIPFLAFVLAPMVFRGAHERDLLLKCLVLVGLYLGATAYFEIIGPRTLVFPSWINSPSLGIHYGRARGPFLSAEPDGMVMLVAAAASWYGLFRLKPLWRLVCLATAVLASLGCLLTLTRSIWLAFVLAFVLLGLRDARLRKWLPVAVLVVAIGLAGALSHFSGIKDTAQDRAETDSSLYDRASTNAAAVRMVEANPLYGVGWMRFPVANGDYVRQAPDVPIGQTKIDAHNVVLGRAAETGLPGVTLWLLALLLGPIRTLLPARRRPGVRLGPVDRVLGPGERTGWGLVAAAATCAYLAPVMFSPVPYPLPNLLVWLLAGLALADRDRGAE